MTFEGVTLGDSGSISHHFLTFYKPNYERIKIKKSNQQNNQPINPQWRSLVVAQYKTAKTPPTNYKG